MPQRPRLRARKFGLSLEEIAALTGESISAIKRQSVKDPAALAAKVDALQGEKSNKGKKQISLTLSEDEHAELWLYMHTIFGTVGELGRRIDAAAPGSTNALAAFECLERAGRCLEIITESTPKQVMARAKASEKHFKNWFAKMDEDDPTLAAVAKKKAS